MRVVCLGCPPNRDREKQMRRKFKLPVTKQLVYHPSQFVDVHINILSYWVEKEYESYKTMGIRTEDGKAIAIHERYLIAMQSPRFIEQMKASRAELGGVQK